MHATGRYAWQALATLAIAGLLAACSPLSGRTAPHMIAPVHDVRNSPVPVPRPRLKPAPPQSRVAAAPAPVRATPVAADAASVTVRRGDTVYGLARRHGVPIEELVALNRLDPPYVLRVGQRLALPGPRLHVVRRGETAWSIARHHDTQVEDLARLNRLRAPFLLRVGDSLRIPSGSGAEMSLASRVAPSLPPPPPRAGTGFDWPVAGSVVSGFGPKEGGHRNDGINIAAPRGAPVRAAEAGTVAYADSGLRGFGKLILIRHADDWVTAYAHNEELLVGRGDRVERGQTIARVGSSGGVVDPQLHFEVRRGTRAVDPMAHLPRLTASAR